MANLARQQLDFDAAAVAWTEVDELADPFTALSDQYTVFLVQNNGVGALALVISARISEIQTPFGPAAVSDMSLSVPADAAVYCFRVPPQVYANGAGIISINPSATPDAKIACLRLVPPGVAGAYVAGVGQPAVSTIVRNSLVEVTGATVSSLDTMRKGARAIWLAQNGGAADVVACIQTSDANQGRDFGRLYGWMKNEFTEAPAIDFLVNPVTIPNDSEWYAFVRPEGALVGEAADVGIVCEDDLTIARLDMDVAHISIPT